MDEHSLPLRDALRSATADVHARMHLHAGMAAIANGRIGREGYRRLLVRLYGFYLPFEAAAGLAPLRSGWLASDLVALGTPESQLSSIGCCPDLPQLDSDAALIGAMYVVEGSALGGRQLARNLGGQAGGNTQAGKRFLASDGADTGRAWRAFCERLNAVPDDARRTVIDAAVTTFCCFESWLDGWEAADNA
ncbi:biliverdin-producing heme oxygenase [Sandarakinorhabdus sp.]|uniref:biliverdin-producing heme oxygenase n=1 Tax=Sandarakinorhabdus sp. TaxID=1916663 RepID=UPI00286E44BC|nr:biliverdin-producing heme oxygenase [Sandarakinorhabdus sp.]